MGGSEAIAVRPSAEPSVQTRAQLRKLVPNRFLDSHLLKFDANQRDGLAELFRT